MALTRGEIRYHRKKLRIISAPKLRMERDKKVHFPLVLDSFSKLAMFCSIQKMVAVPSWRDKNPKQFSTTQTQNGRSLFYADSKIFGSVLIAKSLS